jgi:hypothetical protein
MLFFVTSRIHEDEFLARKGEKKLAFMGCQTTVE